MHSSLITSQIRACSYPHTERPTEKETLNRGPCTREETSTLRNSIAAHLVFVVMSWGTNHLIPTEEWSPWALRGCCMPPLAWHVFWAFFFPSTVIDLCGSVLLTKGMHFQDSWPGFGMHSAAVTGPRYMPTWGRPHALNLISFKPHTLSQMDVEHSQEALRIYARHSYSAIDKTDALCISKPPLYVL